MPLQLARIYRQRAGAWISRSVAMVRGGMRPWWRWDATASEDMTYECDARLGRPSGADCTHIEWEQLLPASDTLEVGPGLVTFLHSSKRAYLRCAFHPTNTRGSETCYLAISATVNIILTWSQIRAALSALLNTCVQHPFQAAQGGRAYYRAPPAKVSGRKLRKRSDSTGLNALPLHANITVFQQLEPWTNPTVELKTCTWLAINKGLPVSTCKN